MDCKMMSWLWSLVDQTDNSWSKVNLCKNECKYCNLSQCNAWTTMKENRFFLVKQCSNEPLGFKWPFSKFNAIKLQTSVLTEWMILKSNEHAMIWPKYAMKL